MVDSAHPCNIVIMLIALDGKFQPALDTCDGYAIATTSGESKRLVISRSV